MEKLEPQQQQTIKKISTEQMRVKLAKAGYDEEHIAGMDREALVAVYVYHLLKPRVL